MTRAILPTGSSDSLRALVACVRASTGKKTSHEDAAGGGVRFVTISRQSGAGGKSLATRLVALMNARAGRDGQPWSVWDRELVEKVAADHHISRELIESVTETGRSWVDQLVSDLATAVDHATPDDLTVYRRVAATVRALAEAGHVVIVGRGGMCITRDMPGGLHLRLVAPLEYRVRQMAAQLHLSHKDAANHVRQVDRGRTQFYERYFPGVTLDAEHFSITFNTARLPEEPMAECVAAILTSRSGSVPAATPQRVS